MLWLRGSIPYPYFYTNYWKYVHFFYATIIASRMPTPSLWIYLKTYQFFKITEKCSIYYHIFILMYCVVTRSQKIRILENMFTWLIYCYSALQWVSYVAFPICLFESNWRNSHILSPHSYIIFTVLDLKFPIPCQMQKGIFRKFRYFHWPEDVFQIFNLR